MALLNEYGVTLCTPDREATLLDLPEAGTALLGLPAVDDDEDIAHGQKKRGRGRTLVRPLP